MPNKTIDNDAEKHPTSKPEERGFWNYLTEDIWGAFLIIAIIIPAASVSFTMLEALIVPEMANISPSTIHREPLPMPRNHAIGDRLLFTNQAGWFRDDTVTQNLYKSNQI